MLRLLKDLYEGILDIIYPPFCVNCGKSDTTWFCPDCRSKIEYLEPPYCTRCGISCATGICADCKDRTHNFTSAHSATMFAEPIVEVIHQFKYGGHLVLSDCLADIMIQRFPKTELAGKVDIVVAIPEERGRLLDRGFNQAEELASRLAHAVSLDYEPEVLCKIKKTSQQVGLAAEARARNLVGAYDVAKTGAIFNKRVLVVDDVMTTGSTLDEAARALKSAGASSVRAFVLSRGV